MTSKHEPIYHERLLTAVVDFLLLSGLHLSKVRDLASKVLEKVQRRTTSVAHSARSTSGLETIPAVVLYRWHQDRNLLDSDANPKPLKLYGRAPSVEALVRDEGPIGSPRQIVRDMRALGLVRARSRGRYVPRSRVATIATLHPVLIEHVAQSLLRLLETVERNVNATNKNDGLIERFTHVPDLPVKDIAAFTAFSQEQGSAFLASVDDWLESRRSLKKGGKRCSAGIHVFAHVREPRKS